MGSEFFEYLNEPRSAKSVGGRYPSAFLDSIPNQSSAMESTRVRKPHRGLLILILGILGFFVFPCAIIAWVLGNSDLREMDACRMDQSGRSETQTGKTLGMIAVAIAACFFLLGIVMFGLVGTVMSLR
jgi:hypothetical protein